MTDTPKFTPGPWINHHESLWPRSDIPLVVQFRIHSMEGQVLVRVPKIAPNADANAHLIAAAPDLYAALEMARGYVARANVRLAFGGELTKPDFAATVKDGAAIDAALAKARGEKS